MTRVVFENATIRDVVSKASKVSPKSGNSAFDQANGIIMEVDTDQNQITVRATNMEIFYMEITDAVEMTGVSRSWRIPTALIDGICSKLPITSGKQAVFDDKDSMQLEVTSGRMVAKMRMSDPTYFPMWEAFDPTELSPVADFGARIQQVQWAASKNGTPPMTGVRLDGLKAGATDSYRIALTPCEIPHLIEPVTIPASIFAPLMKSLGEVRIGQEKGHLLVMPDESTQIRAVLFDGQYPNLDRVMKRNEPNAVMVQKSALNDMIERAMVMGARDRTPILKMFIGEEEIAVMMEDQELGLLGDVVELPAQCTHPRALFGFTPDNLTSALSMVPNENVTFYYTPDKPMAPIRLDGGSGYEVLIMPRKVEPSEQ